jgi:hypothetical protein
MHSSSRGAPLNKLVEKLISLGAPDVEFHSRYLLDHFRGTYELLNLWKQSEDLCLAGLYHSVYLTQFFISNDPNDDNRDIIRNILGVDAERLVYLYCVIDRRQFIRTNAVSGDRVVFDSYKCQDVELTPTEFANLVTLIWANAFEQLFQPGVDESTKLAEKGALEKTLHLVGEDAKQAFANLYSEGNFRPINEPNVH